LIGYGQLFAPLFKDAAAYAPIAICKASTHYQSLPIKGAEKEAIYIEEEDDDESFKKHSEESTTSVFLYLPAYVIQHLKSGLSYHKSFFHSALSRYSFLIFCVFRL